MQGSEHKQKMTFRLEPELAAALKQLPNQTAFVEAALREAMGRQCPLCHGTGQASGVHLNVSNFKSLPIRRLDRSTAAQLKALVHLGRQLLATQLMLEPSDEDQGLAFRLAREDQLLLSGKIPRGKPEVRLAH